jgi:hypothetical protein
MTDAEQRAYAMLCFWMRDNRREITGRRGEARFRALYAGVHAAAEAAGLPDALVRRLIRVAIAAVEAPAGDEADAGPPHG